MLGESLTILSVYDISNIHVCVICMIVPLLVASSWTKCPVATYNSFIIVYERTYINKQRIFFSS
jgi:hypothetical protein